MILPNLFTEGHLTLNVDLGAGGDREGRGGEGGKRVEPCYLQEWQISSKMPNYRPMPKKIVLI